MTAKHTTSAHARAQSTVVQNFSDDLDSMFGLQSPGTLGRLAETVQLKKQVLNTADRELQDLEARLRETERRLAQVSGYRPGTPRGIPKTTTASTRGSATNSRPSTSRKEKA
ncbi:hypothetical protein K470DRAFT_268889 [Piedraia hortae CBS 480.64]|uniref:Uncharacterized protein n=1 Tax=Piedraia hortae CBS 480.64 TaxID=1314780 RepID=A0A6A7C5N6_9PEZI|nr:hypothetical protein K470DRAFT_268889 [Piedraia hortae CBS 480.64]